MTPLDVRLRAQLRIAIARHDRVAELVLLSRIYPTPWRPADESYPVFVARVTEKAA